MHFLDQEQDQQQDQEQPGQEQPGGLTEDFEPELDPDTRRRQFMVRRIVALGAAILILILIVLAVRGCLNARKERAFQTYVSDVTTLANESNQLSKNFFGRLNDPEQLSDLSFEGQVNADKGTAEELLSRARALDAPNELGSAQSDIVLTFELRRDGLAAIASQLNTATGGEGSGQATRRITDQMATFLASDVLYRRGRGRADTALAQEDVVTEELPKSVFLPDEPDWLDEATVAAALSRVTGAPAGDVTGVHGLGLISTSINEVALTPGAQTTVSAGDRVEMVVSVQNQGESDETDVGVSFTMSGGGANITGKETISSIPPGETQDVTLPVSPAPPKGQPVTLEVVVDTVPGEQVEDNNRAEYTVLFQ